MIFVDTVRPHNGYLDSLGADFDGDTMSLRAVFSVEANMEAEKLINESLSFILNQNGTNARSLGKESILSLYSLTRSVDNI